MSCLCLSLCKAELSLTSSLCYFFLQVAGLSSSNPLQAQTLSSSLSQAQTLSSSLSLVRFVS
ncbi:unnamed protein product [Brassica oleracea]